MAFTNEQLERYSRHIILKADLEHRQPFTLQQQVWEPSGSRMQMR